MSNRDLAPRGDNNQDVIQPHISCDPDNESLHDEEPNEDDDNDNNETGQEQHEPPQSPPEPVARKSTRNRRPPVYLQDYVSN